MIRAHPKRQASSYHFGWMTKRSVLRLVESDTLLLVGEVVAVVSLSEDFPRRVTPQSPRISAVRVSESRRNIPNEDRFKGRVPFVEERLDRDAILTDNLPELLGATSKVASKNKPFGPTVGRDRPSEGGRKVRRLREVDATFCVARDRNDRKSERFEASPRVLGLVESALDADSDSRKRLELDRPERDDNLGGDYPTPGDEHRPPKETDRRRCAEEVLAHRDRVDETRARLRAARHRVHTRSRDRRESLPDVIGEL